MSLLPKTYNIKHKQEPFWALATDKVLEILKTSEHGLSEKDAAERLDVFGANTIPENGRAKRTKIFINQFKSPLIFILLIAGAVTILLKDVADSLFIFAAVIVNAILGFYQENKAETALAKLKTYIKERVRVIRENREYEISAEDIVSGDIVHLHAGSRVPADARIISANELMVDESVLTGESLPVSKSEAPVAVDTGTADRSSMVLGGSLVAEGIGLAVVTATGAETELGKIAALVVGAHDGETPLQKAIRKFSLRVGVALFAAAVILFVAGAAIGYDIYEMFLISVAVAVAAVPEGLPIAMTVVLAVGVERLAKRNGVVRRLLAAEVLGGTTVILTDKTGTLTEGKMKLTKIVGDKRPEDILRLALFATDVIVENPEDKPDEWRIVGRALETAIVKAAAEHSVLFPEIIGDGDNTIIERRPFNSDVKYSASYIKIGNAKHWIYLGAPDVLILQSAMGKAEKDNMILQLDEMAYAGHRVIGVARDGEILGMLAFNDPIRKSVGDAIRRIAGAGVKTVIATGDHKGTALAVAKELGINAEDGEIVTGEELSRMGDIELEKRLYGIKIFARVSPADKLRITKMYKKKGEVIAVTGDGVNDAPALKGADIGVAVGSGTDVAKEASDLVILDDNFETIVAAINEGKRILGNIKKVIVYLLSNALDEIILIGGALLVGVALPVNALQILWINFFSDSFPAVALAFEKDTDSLKNSPSRMDGRLLDKEMRFLVLVIGIISSVLLLALYMYLLSAGHPEDVVRTFIFGSLALYTLFLVFSIKSLKRSIFSYNLFDNRYLIIGALVGALMTMAAIYTPALQDMFGTVSLPPVWLLGIVAVGLANIAAIELGKFLFRRK